MIISKTVIPAVAQCGEDGILIDLPIGLFKKGFLKQINNTNPDTIQLLLVAKKHPSPDGSTHFIQVVASQEMPFTLKN